METILDNFNRATKVCVVLTLWAAAAIALPAQTFSSLHSFGGTDGALPQGALAQGADGNLYGTTAGGGANGDGTVFEVSPQGVLTTVHSFNGTDGAQPFSALALGTDGNLYGTTNAGGTSTACTGGCGTVFRFAGGTLTSLHSFSGTDGAIPQGGLVLGPDGNFWGTTVQGGTKNCIVNANGCGTAYNITPTGTLTTLYGFTGRGEGGNSYSPLVLAKDGDFYGTAFNGGNFGKGSIFKLTLKGIVAIVHGFCSQGPPCSDGANPVGGMVQDPNGALYGTTSAGGNGSCSVNGSVGCGTVFSITLGAALTTIHTFGGPDGSGPVATLSLANTGNFYGTTPFGGANNSCNAGCGTVFGITLSGKMKTLYSFCSQSGCADGSQPYGGLVQYTNGTLYGTTPAGGANGDGTVFTLSGLSPFVETLPFYGMVGATVEILGSDLTGATSVTFNGTAASFNVVSNFLIDTTVPTGATTGKVKVVTPNGPLSSNLPFKVLNQ